MKNFHNISIITVIAVLYFLNQRYKTAIDNEYLRFFMTGYFNDIIGCIALASYINLVFSIFSYKDYKIWYIMGIIFVAGLFWEFITPLFRKDTVTDMFDLLAYLIGGSIYCSILKFYKKSSSGK